MICGKMPQQSTEDQAMQVTVYLDSQPVFICPADEGDWVLYDPQDGSITTGAQIAETNTGSLPVNDRQDAAGRGAYLGL